MFVSFRCIFIVSFKQCRPSFSVCKFVLWDLFKNHINLPQNSRYDIFYGFCHDNDTVQINNYIRTKCAELAKYDNVVVVIFIFVVCKKCVWTNQRVSVRYAVKKHWKLSEILWTYLWEKLATKTKFATTLAQELYNYGVFTSLWSMEFQWFGGNRRFTLMIATFTETLEFSSKSKHKIGIARKRIFFILYLYWM